MMRRICFLSMDDLAGYVADDDLAIEPLAELGIEVETLSWRQTSVPWERFDAVVIRTPWDYQREPEHFLGVLAGIESRAKLYNPLEVVKWNLDKKYLRDLADNGCHIVPTIWGKEYSPAAFDRWLSDLSAAELIIKPNISATAEHTYRLRSYDRTIESVFRERPFMVQPFVESVVSEGEYSLFYFNGRLSHAINKSPKSGDFRVQEEHGGIITAAEATEEMRDAGAKALRGVAGNLLYARVDLVRYGGEFCLIELELIEPALYLRMDSDAPQRFACAIAEKLRETQG